jgi:hypothetical protein
VVGEAPADDGSVDLTDPNAIEPNLGVPGLSAAQASKVRSMITDGFSTDFGEQSYTFVFNAISCNFIANTCKLTLHMKPFGDATSYARACTMTKLSSFSQLVSTAANGHQSLTDRFANKLDTCIIKVEDSLY